ncbi:inheritance of peroxisomes protein 1-domain-containing protein [Xylariaceae sp. FL1651]|nr:inheritance of peroxisomes protein 1-domain-containing protein [Xylariaceae sp. FL1651]
MAGSSGMDAPRFPIERPDIPRPRRVVTAPVSSAAPLQRSKSSSATSRSDDLVETLYNHPCIKIVSFTSSRRSLTTSLPASSDTDVPPGTLPPSSRLERTIAVGPFRIYRAPGSVAFLSCGSALQPILPKSQCWCISEDNSRFVLQIRRPQYWRLEVPVTDPNDAHRAVLLRDVFGKILLFEQTECPFERSFTVQLPDPPETPVKKKAWTAEGKNLISSPFQSDLSPPAHAPTTIIRRKQTRSIPHETPLLGSEPTVNDKSHEEPQPETGHCSSEAMLSDHGHGKDNNDTLPGVQETSSGFPVSMDNAIDDPKTPQRSTSPAAGFTNVEELQDPRNSAKNFSLQKRKVTGEEPHVEGTQLPSPELANGREILESGEAFSELQAQSYSTASEENVTANVSQLGDRLDVKGCGSPEVVQNSILVPGQTVACPSKSTCPETQQPHSPTSEGSSALEQNRLRDKEEDSVSFEGSGHVTPVNLTRKRMTRMLAGRSFTAPPQLALVTSPPAKLTERSAARRAPPPQPSVADGQSPSASTDSFHSVQSWHSPITPLPPSPPESRSESPRLRDFSPPPGNIAVPDSVAQVADSSEHMATPKNAGPVLPGSWGVMDDCDSAESTPRGAQSVIGEKSEEPVSTERNLRVSRPSALKKRLSVRRRSHANNLSISRRALSPLPPAASLFSPPPRQTSQSRLAAVRRLPAAIVHKTVEILLSPPSHLVNLMLKVAAKIAAGEWRGLVFGLGEAGEQIPVQWDYYSDGEFSSLSDDDDYTLANNGPNHSGDTPRTDTRRGDEWTDDDDHGTWEID